MASEVEQERDARGPAATKAAGMPLSPDDTVNREGVEEALRTSWRAPRAVDLFP